MWAVSGVSTGIPGAVEIELKRVFRETDERKPSPQPVTRHAFVKKVWCSSACPDAHPPIWPRSDPDRHVRSDHNEARMGESNSQSAPGAMSVDEFCRWARIGRTSTYNEIANGRLRALKVGRRTVIPAEAARQWLEALKPVASNGSHDHD